MSLSAEDLQKAKTIFLGRFTARYAKETPENVALRDAMTSASKRCHLYRPGLSQKERYDGPRKGWAFQLAELLKKYESMEVDGIPLTPDIFKTDADALKAHMMENYGSFFCEKTDRAYPPGFRIANAQKSLALVLKHNWCMGNLKNAPPLCVLDNRILEAANVDVSRYAWTRIDTWNEYDEMIELLARAAAASPHAPISLAEWELLTFG